MPASIDRPMPANTGRDCRRRPTISVSRWRRIRAKRKPPGSFRRSKTEIRMPRDGALCVTRTDDGGQSWEVMRHGLPQRDAYDLIYRHGLEVDEGGERLAMGSTTGALWTSDNGGRR